MTEPRDARQDVLAAIREHLAASAPHDAAWAGPEAQHTPRAADARPATPGGEPCTLIQRFQAALQTVAGHCAIVAGEDEAARTVRQILDERGATRVTASDAPIVRRVLSKLPSGPGVPDTADGATVFESEAGVTGAQWGVAETGTLVLVSDVERHRLASLVPPVHIALLEAGRLRETMADVLDELAQGGPGALARTVTFITGPSRTSDIELTLAIGVHGPALLHVVVILG